MDEEFESFECLELFSGGKIEIPRQSSSIENLILKINALLPNFLPSLSGLQFEDISYISRTFTMGGRLIFSRGELRHGVGLLSFSI